MVGAIRQVDEEPERPEKVEEKHGEAADAEKDGKVEEKTWQDDTGIGDIYRYAFQHAWEGVKAAGHTFKVLHHWEYFGSLKEFLEYQAYFREAMEDEDPVAPFCSQLQEQAQKDAVEFKSKYLQEKKEKMQKDAAEVKAFKEYCRAHYY